MASESKPSNYSYDFYSPFMSAAILTKDGQRVPLFMNTENGAANSYGNSAKKLTTLQGSSKDSAAITEGIVSLPWLSSLVVEQNLSYLPKMTAVLTPPFQDGLAFLNSSLVEWGVSMLEVQIGYSTGPNGSSLSPPLQGLLLKPEIAIGAEIVITLNAHGVAGYSSGVQCSGRTWSSKDGFTRIKVIEECIKGSGTPKRDITVEYDAITEENGKEYDLLCNKPVNITQGWITDWMLVRNLVRECHCWMSLVGNTLHIFSQNSKMAAQPKYTLRLFNFDRGTLGPGATRPQDQQSPGSDFPIISCNSPTSAVWLPGSTVTMFGVDRDTGEPKTVVKSVADDKTAATGGGSVDMKGTENRPDPDSKTGDGGQGSSYDINFPAADQQLQAEVLQLKTLMGIRLDVTTLGIPDVMPGDVVKIAGIGRRFDANYSVFHVKHSIGNGFTTDLLLRSNSAEYLAALQKSAGGDVNKKEPSTKESNVSKSAEDEQTQLPSTRVHNLGR